jgi:hypothetical protein
LDTTLDVQVSGTGFEPGSRADWLLGGSSDPRVRTNSTRFVSSTALVANITISLDAPASAYDIAVTTAAGKKGIGTELFTVLPIEVLAGGAHGSGLNVFGVAVGDGPSNISCVVSIVPILWRADGTKEVLPLGSYCGGSARAINQVGTVLGQGSGGAPNAGVIWVPTDGGYVLQDLGPAADGLNPITAGGLNDANEIIGWAQGGPKLYWWSPTTGWTTMQTPANATLCQVYAGINNRGEIVGKCTVGGIQNGYYWASHTAAPVMLPRPGATGDVTPRDINDSGVIVGYVYGANSAWRWTPNGSGFTVDRLPDAGRGSVAFSIAEDGTISGDVYGGANKPLPALWPQGGAYKFLGLTSSGAWGEAMGVVVTPAGLVTTGTQGNQYALRWK